MTNIPLYNKSTLSLIFLSLPRVSRAWRTPRAGHHDQDLAGAPRTEGAVDVLCLRVRGFGEVLVYHDEEVIYFEARRKESGVVRLKAAELSSVRS